MRKIRSRKLKKQKYMVIIGSFLFLSIFSVGYAAFSTTISLNAKGNVHPSPTYTIDQLKATALTEGTTDGLYVDSAEQGRYVFKGGNPNNYLTLNNETWRIISIEADNTLKIMREDSIESIPFDPGRSTVIAGVTENDSDVGTRYSTTSTDFCYYSSNVGCKVWGSKDTMRNSSGVLLKDASGDGTAKMQRTLSDATTYDLPDDEAYLNVYLNGGTYAGVSVAGWYQTWSSTLSNTIKSYIDDDHLWNVGLVSRSSGQLIATDIAQEKALTWQGRVGLMTVSEYVRASTNLECTGVYAYYNSSSCYDNQASHNYMVKNSFQRTISPFSHQSSAAAWNATSSNLNCAANSAMYSHGVRPVLYLSSNVQLKGDGTSGSKFQIKAN